MISASSLFSLFKLVFAYTIIVVIAVNLSSCGGGSGSNSSNDNADESVVENADDAVDENPNNTPNTPAPSDPNTNPPVAPGNPSSLSYCDSFIGQTDSYFCADFQGISPKSMVGKIPPMSFRDQTFREYTQGEIFNLADPTPININDNVFNLHTDTVDGLDFSSYAAKTETAAEKWDITVHSRDGYVSPGSNAGSNDDYFWNENAFMGEHGKRCGLPPSLGEKSLGNPLAERAYNFISLFFQLPENYDGDENNLSDYWLSENEKDLTDDTGIHHIVRYEDMIYTCADHLMTAAYGSGASKLSLTPNHLLDTSSGKGVVEFDVSTYRTAGRDYWQLDLTPLATHLQLPEGDVVADANGKAFNGFNINTHLDDSPLGAVGVLGGINVFRTMHLKNGEFLENGNYIDPNDPNAVFTRAQIANPGNPERLQLYSTAPENADWVIKHSNYNQVMLDYLLENNTPDMNLLNVTSNRKRERFRLSILKIPNIPAWAAEANQWDQVSLCMPEFVSANNNGCVGEYIVPELSKELLVQFTHYAYNTTKSCDNAGQPHGFKGASFQSNCHPNTYHWDNFYLSPTKPFTIIKAKQRTAKVIGQDQNNAEIIRLQFEQAAPAKTKLRFNALTGGTNADGTGDTTLEVSFDNGTSWVKPNRQAEPENNFDKFRSYYTGEGANEYIPEGVTEVLFRANNPRFKDAFWIRDASFWSFSDN